jgi:hypothetical protein
VYLSLGSNDRSGQEAAGSHACAVSESQDWVSHENLLFPPPWCWSFRLVRVADIRSVKVTVMAKSN